MAQAEAADTFLATAAYGDDGPWYIPLRHSFEEGGYEPTASFVARDTEADYRQALSEIRQLAESEPDRGTPEGDRLDALALIVEAYGPDRWGRSLEDAENR